MKQRINILLTGGAGFIGSNLAERLLSLEQVGHVRILDNLLTGKFENIRPFSNHPKLEFVLGDIRDYQTCLNACEGMDVICHQAALGSVPRSLNDPITTNAINVSGMLNLFTAARECGIRKIVHACSSSTYGDSKKLPKVEAVSYTHLTLPTIYSV